MPNEHTHASAAQASYAPQSKPQYESQYDTEIFGDCELVALERLERLLRTRLTGFDEDSSRNATTTYAGMASETINPSNGYYFFDVSSDSMPDARYQVPTSKFDDHCVAGQPWRLLSF